MDKKEKQIAIVTGGSRGIGRAICLEFAKRGFTVVINYSSSREEAEETEKLCQNVGAETMLAQADVADPDACRKMMQEAAALTGQIAVLVNNAGITRDTLAIRMKPEDFSRVIETNLKGSFYCMKEAASWMLRSRYGRIISISSIVGLHGNAGQINYAASKAGIIGMTKTLAKELARKGITVNAVAPGLIETGMSAEISEQARDRMLASIPAGRIGEPQDVAAAVAFLASEEAGYITGQVLGVDGGMGI